MGKLIDKSAYLLKLQDVMDEVYPDVDYRRMSQYALNPKVKEIMSAYVIGKYGTYHSDNLPALLKESHSLLEECLNELGMTK